ncbi:hypothetical protein Tsubulata_033724 [Turnera subulata]|uniref:Factor of DNA methylation 1-5/IDN2 domain-containing protein n=1 Tax=Turnera subulata TaxID=218843 RepID=A0A9Q0GEG5_9ROSI|nr:hypothetical protein Tsubulata_033724 [Turnera subulata]
MHRNLEEELDKERGIVKGLVAEIDYKNHKLCQLQLDLDETNRQLREVVNDLMEAISSRDKSSSELDRLYKESSAYVRCLKNEITMQRQFMGQMTVQREFYTREINNLKHANRSLRKNEEKQTKKFKLLSEELKELRAQNEIKRKTLTDDIERTERACKTKELMPLAKELEEEPGASMNDGECGLKECLQLTEKLEECNSCDDQGNSSVNVMDLSIVEPIENSQTLDLIEFSGCLSTELDELKMDLKKKEDELKEKEEDLQNLESCYNVLITKEYTSNQQMQQAREELISGLQNILTNRTSFAIKRMGELDHKSFYEACLLKFPNEDWEDKAAKLCSFWEENLKDPHWHPFKKEIIRGQQQETIDDGDEKLKELRKEYGDIVYSAVTTALQELNEYNASGRYPVPEIWNVKEGRKASLKEIVHYLLMKGLRRIQSRNTILEKEI